MRTTVYQDDFISFFRGSQYEGQFSGEALIAIYKHITELEEDTETETELDIVDIACTYCEAKATEELLEALKNEGVWHVKTCSGDRVVYMKY